MNQINTKVLSPMSPKIMEELKPLDKLSDGFGFSNYRMPDLKISDDRYGDKEEFPVARLDEDRHRKNLFITNNADVKMIAKVDTPADYLFFDIIKTINERNNVIEIFFTKRNVDHIQVLLIKMVKYLTGHYISPQDENQLLTVMRAKYLDATVNGNATGITLINEICALNKDVLDWVVPNVISQIKLYISYSRDHGMDPHVLPLPEYTSAVGLKITRGTDFNII